MDERNAPEAYAERSAETQAPQEIDVTLTEAKSKLQELQEATLEMLQGGEAGKPKNTIAPDAVLSAEAMRHQEDRVVVVPPWAELIEKEKQEESEAQKNSLSRLFATQHELPAVEQQDFMSKARVTGFRGTPGTSNVISNRKARQAGSERADDKEKGADTSGDGEKEHKEKKEAHHPQSTWGSWLGYLKSKTPLRGDVEAGDYFKITPTSIEKPQEAESYFPRAASNEDALSSYHRSLRSLLQRDLQPELGFSVHQVGDARWTKPWEPYDPGMYGDRAGGVNEQKAERGRLSAVRRFVLTHPVAIALLRALMLSFSVIVMALAARTRVDEIGANVKGIVGISTLLQLIFCPMLVVHNLVTLYIDSFGAPIGLWRLSLKMAHTLVELVLICLWSSLLSLAFADYVQGSLNCVGQTDTRYNRMPLVLGNGESSAHFASRVCQLEAASCSFLLVGVLLNIGVMSISLYRIFDRVVR